MGLVELLNHGFVLRAVIAGSFIAILSAILGVFLVLRRLSLIGDGLAHVTFGGVAVGLLVGTYPLAAALPIVMLTSIGILKLIEKARLFGDAAIGLVSSLGVACGIMLASAAGGFNVDLFSYLFGNILAVSQVEVILSVVLSLVLIVIITLFYHDLLAVTFDEDAAKTTGINVKRINAILVLMTSLTVVLAMKVVGIMLISSLLILPSVTALQVTRSFRMTLMVACLLGVLSVVLGVFISFVADMPTGATIVILNFCFFISLLLAKKLTSGRPKRAPPVPG
jgi:zinc transport system permease protein